MVLKSILFNFIFYFSIIFFGVLFLPFLISKRLTRLVVKFWAGLIITSLKNIIGCKVLYENKHIKNNEGYLIAANHQSVFDTIFFLKKFDKVIYIVKKELKYIPIYGWYASRLGNIFLNRKERIKSLKILSIEVGKAISQKYKVIIFPEGTRQTSNVIGSMKPGIFSVQNSCKCLVYPIYISSYLTWPKNSFIKSNKDIKVKTLDPIKCYAKKNQFLIKLTNQFQLVHKKELKK